jgi:phage shock protein C
MICPYCKSEILPGAIRCAACTSWMPGSRPAREWTRPRQGRSVAGVCRGLSDIFGIPVAALRVLFILSIVLGGWGIIAYLALWIAMPSQEDRPQLPQYAPPREDDRKSSVG